MPICQGHSQGGSGGSAEPPPPSKLMIFMAIVMPWKNTPTFYAHFRIS